MAWTRFLSKMSAARGTDENASPCHPYTLIAAVHDSADGTSRTSRDVRLESAKWAKADTDHVSHQTRFYEYRGCGKDALSAPHLVKSAAAARSHVFF